MKKYDLAVIGAGSGGLAAAKRAAKLGLSVVIIEGDRVGGTCVLRGCVPKKLLVYGSMYRNYLKDCEGYGIEIDNFKSNSSKLLHNIRKEVDRLNELHIRLLNDCQVKILSGWAEFVDNKTISIKNNRNKSDGYNIQADTFLIAVGSIPNRPEILGANLPWVSDDIFLQNDLPESIHIIGAGYIACEFACILNSLGVKVTLLVRKNHILNGFEKGITSILEESMINNGIDILFSTQPKAFKPIENRIEILDNHNNQILADSVLLAAGRRPNIDSLALDKVGIKINNGSIIVDQFNKTNISNIFALGDAANSVNLTPVAIEEGRCFVDTQFANNPRKVNYSLIPKAVFSTPEVSTVGLSEEDALDEYGLSNVEVFNSKFRPMSQALTSNKTPCLLKLVIESSSKKILGCHMVGPGASEIIQMASISLLMGATKNDFDKTMALHPTTAEEFVTMI